MSASRRFARRAARREALAAVRSELDPVRAGEYEVNAPDLVEAITKLVADGKCTAAEAAEAMTFANDLADSTVAGDLEPEQGVALMAQLGNRHRGKHGAN